MTPPFNPVAAIKQVQEAMLAAKTLRDTFGGNVGGGRDIYKESLALIPQLLAWAEQVPEVEINGCAFIGGNPCEYETTHWITPCLPVSRIKSLRMTGWTCYAPNEPLPCPVPELNYKHEDTNLTFSGSEQSGEFAWRWE